MVVIVQTGISILPTDDYSDLIGYFNTGKIKYLELCKKNYLSSPQYKVIKSRYLVSRSQ